MHIVNKDMPIRFNMNPGIKQTTSRTEVPRRTDLYGIANSLGITPFPTDVYTVEYNGETKYDGLNLAIEKRFADYWSARLSYAVGKGEGNTAGTPTATNDFQVLDQRYLEQNYGPTNADRRHAVTLSGRVEVRKIPGLTAGAVARFATGTPFTIHNSNIDANRNGVLVDPLPAGTYSGTGLNAMTFENAGGRNGAYGPGTTQVDIRSGYKMRLSGVQTVDFFFEVFNVTNEANFANPSGDVRSGATFLVPTALAGGGFPRQFQIGARYGF
jgi:hypothetical protein